MDFKPAAARALLALSLLASSAAFATIDTKNANYTESWVDAQIPSSGFALRVQRIYNSRSVFSGMYGFGWCSEFETVLEKTPEGFLKVQDCGAGQELNFRPKVATEHSLEKTVELIVAYYKRTNPNAGDATVTTLKDQLRNDSDLRIRWAKQAGLVQPTAKKGSVYTSDTIEVDRIEFDGSNYTRTLADGSSQRFNSNGKLTALFDRNGNSLKFNYAGDLLKEAIDSAGKRLTYSYYPTKRVKEINGPNGVKVEYKFKGEDLAEVKNMWTNTYSYLYDDNHNLTRVNFPDKTFKALTYNQKNDWVLSFTDRSFNGAPACKETYEYHMDKVNPKDHFWSNVVRKCGEEVKNEARFEFWLKTRADGRKVLARVANRSSSESFDISYHPENGRPTSIKRNSQTTSFDYYANGLVREKSTATTRLLYEYKNSFNKVSKVNTEFFDPNGKVIKKRETTFGYDGKGNLTAAQNSDGQTVKLSYDQKGRIASITDQAKKEIQFKYDEKTGRTAQITRPKVGTIAVSYKTNGDLNILANKDDDTVRTQVTSTLNNLLDVIGPATAELNL